MKRSIAEEQSVFESTDVKISVEGKCELGAPIGTQSFVTTYVAKKVEGWTVELDCLCQIACSQPQEAYSAFCHGLRGKWLYLTRTVPGISSLMRPLEDKIRNTFLPIITGQPAPNDLMRALLSLPARLGGLSIIDPSAEEDAEYAASIRLTAPLVTLIVLGETTLGD